MDPATVKVVRIQDTASDGSLIEMSTEVSRAPGGAMMVKFLRYDRWNPKNPLSFSGLFAGLFPAGSTREVYSFTVTIEALPTTGEVFSGSTSLSVLVSRVKM